MVFSELLALRLAFKDKCVVFALNFRKGSHYLKYFHFLSLYSLSGISVMHILHLLLSNSSGICYFILFLFFLFEFWFWKILLTFPKIRRLSPWPCPDCWWAHQTIPYFCHGVFISRISFGFFLGVSASLVVLPICSCMLPTFFIVSFSILITVVLHSYSDNSKISTSKSGSVVCSVSSNYVYFFLSLSMLCNFGRKSGMMY